MTDLSSARVRAEAARAVARVAAGRTLDDALVAADMAGLTAQNKSLLRALAYGVVRERSLLSNLVNRMLQKPIDKQPEVHALLMAGVQQLRSMRMPAHAAVAETVNAVALLDAHWAKGMVNAVLRRYQRERAELEKALPTDPVVRWSHPEWMVDSIRRDWPRQWQFVLAANNEAGPLTLRVNRRQADPRDWLLKLPGAGLAGTPVEGAPDAVMLEEAVPVEKIPGFAEGQVSVQDASAQFAADLLDLHPGLRVLDACAAPGGKSAHILERVDVDLTALDVDATRVVRVKETLERLKLTEIAATGRSYKAGILVGDARKPDTWWDQKPFDRVLLDAPCSGTGVIRRHPDIKWLRRPADIPRMAQVQFDLLSALWPLLAPGGTLVYAVCSVLSNEGDAIIAAFLETTKDVSVTRIAAEWGEATVHGRRIRTGGAFDGFYYSVLKRKNK